MAGPAEGQPRRRRRRRGGLGRARCLARAPALALFDPGSPGPHRERAKGACRTTATRHTPAQTADRCFQYWAGEFPEAISTGQVELQGSPFASLPGVPYSPSVADHDMFTPQPARGAAVYILRYVAHDWPTGDVRKILKTLAGAAGPESRILLVDYVVQYTCREQGRVAETVPGAERPPPPAPLLQTAGYERGVLMDILVRRAPGGLAGARAALTAHLDDELVQRARAHAGRLCASARWLRLEARARISHWAPPAVTACARPRWVRSSRDSGANGAC
jgi:hypothetical protein